MSTDNEIVAWDYELSTAINRSFGQPVHRNFEKRLTRYKPSVSGPAIRNLRPLYAAPPAPDDIDTLMTWLTRQHQLELSYKRPVREDDDNQTKAWQVHKQHGPINDREWELMGEGDTALDAIRAAHLVMQGPIL